MRLRARVARIESTRVLLESGETRDADAVILATGAHDLRRLVPTLADIRWCSTLSAWFSTPDPSILPRWLLLNGTGMGAFNHGAAMSTIAPGYASAGRGLFVANAASLPCNADNAVDVAQDMRRTVAQILRPSFGRGATDRLSPGCPTVCSPCSPARKHQRRSPILDARDRLRMDCDGRTV